ncbi:MAG: metal dependent phosphohydrolase with sensor, partial [Thermoleophilia bacterium]|nr:metal dependent phosphohydrolase with sensor [Thermoleophilia bacterium]
MNDSEVTTTPSDAQLAWMERHAGRILAAGALVAVNTVLIALLTHYYDVGLVGALLLIGLAVAGFLLLQRSVGRMMRAAVQAARREAQVSRRMMTTVEQIGSEAAGVRGTVEALCASAEGAGLEVFLWDRTERSLWAPSWQQQQLLTSTEARALEDAMAARRPIRIADATQPGSPVPSTLAEDAGGTALVVAPMWSADEFHGLVLRRYATVRDLRRADDDALVASIAAIGAVAIGKAVVVDREQQRARDNELLMRSMNVASETRQRDRLVDHVQQAVEAVRVDRGAILALDAGRLRVVGTVGIERIHSAGAGSIRLRSNLAGLALHAGGAPFACMVTDLDEPSRVVLQRLGFDEGVIVVGLRDGAGLVGMLVIEQPMIGMDEAMGELLSALGQQASMAIERTRMMRSIRKRSRHLACTPKLARSLTGQRDPSAVARIAARELHEGFGFGRVSIALMDESTGLSISASAGAPAAGEAVTSTDVLRECCETGRPYVSVAGDLDDITDEHGSGPDGLHDPDAPVGCRGRIVVPIAGRDRRVTGAIAVYELDPDLLGEDDLHMLETIADQLGGTLEQAELFASLERSYFETVEALSSALEAKDAYTLEHARSITDMSANVGRRLGMREDDIRDLKLGALLHDI